MNDVLDSIRKMLHAPSIDYVDLRFERQDDGEINVTFSSYGRPIRLTEDFPADLARAIDEAARALQGNPKKSE